MVPPRRGRMRPRAGQVAAAATGRTAGWLVAAALAGSLVTLLLAPGRTSPSGLAVVPNHRVAFFAPGARPGGQLRPGKRVSVHVPPGAKIVTIPGRVQVTLPANVPTCGFVVPGGQPYYVPAGPPGCVRAGLPGCVPAGRRTVYVPGRPLPFYFRGRRPFARGVIVGPGKRAFRLRPPALKRIIGKAGRPGGPARRITIHVVPPGRLGRPGGVAIAGLAPGCAMVMPGMRYPAQPSSASASPSPAAS